MGVTNDLVWYPRFGDIPGVSYGTPAGLIVEKLAGSGMQPTTRRYETSVSLDWGNTSRSPASQHAEYNDTSASVARITRRLEEVLELPGTASDYHFALLVGADSLYRRRFAEADALPAVERFCWLDIQLIEARPDAFMVDASKSGDYYRFPTLSRLITLYSTEGYLREALGIVEKTERFGQAEGHREKLLTRIAMVETEDGQ